MDDKIKTMEDQFGAIKDKALDVDAHADKLKTAEKTVKEQIMSNLVGIGSIALLGILAQMLFPWWTIAIVGFWVGFWLAQSPASSFFYGFLSMFLVWSIYAGYQSASNGDLMTNTMSGIFGGKISGTQLIYTTGTLGGLVTGLATVAGTLFRQVLKKVS